MSASRGAILLKRAIEKIEQQKLWEFYCAVYVHMKKKKGFSEFYNEAQARVRRATRKNNLSKEEIIKIAEKIRIRHITQQAKRNKNK